MALSRRTWLSELSRASAVAGSSVFGLLGLRAARSDEDRSTSITLQADQLEGVTAVGDVLVVRDAAGQVRAFSRRCPHLGCSLTVSEGADAFECPCHESRFDLTGQRLKGPAEHDLTPLRVTLESEGRVKIG